MSKTSKKPKIMVQNISCILPQQSQLGGLFLGNVYGAQNPTILKQYGIRAVLTSSIQTNIEYLFNDIPFHMRIQAHDNQAYNIKQHLVQCIEFIQQSRQLTNVYVHCFAGVSRSAAIVCAYIMWKLKWNFQTTMAFVKGKRIVAKPNEGFMRQLVQIEGSLLGLADGDDVVVGLGQVPVLMGQQRQVLMKSVERQQQQNNNLYYTTNTNNNNYLPYDHPSYSNNIPQKSNPYLNLQARHSQQTTNKYVDVQKKNMAKTMQKFIIDDHHNHAKSLSTTATTPFLNHVKVDETSHLNSNNYKDKRDSNNIVVDKSNISNNNNNNNKFLYLQNFFPQSHTTTPKNQAQTINNNNSNINNNNSNINNNNSNINNNNINNTNKPKSRISSTTMSSMNNDHIIVGHDDHNEKTGSKRKSLKKLQNTQVYNTSNGQTTKISANNYHVPKASSTTMRQASNTNNINGSHSHLLVLGGASNKKPQTPSQNHSNHYNTNHYNQIPIPNIKQKSISKKINSNINNNINSNSSNNNNTGRLNTESYSYGFSSRRTSNSNNNTNNNSSSYMNNNIDHSITTTPHNHNLLLSTSPRATNYKQQQQQQQKQLQYQQYDNTKLYQPKELHARMKSPSNNITNTITNKNINNNHSFTQMSNTSSPKYDFRNSASQSTTDNFFNTNDNSKYTNQQQPLHKTNIMKSSSRLVKPKDLPGYKNY